MADEKLIKSVHSTFDIYGLAITKKLSAAVAKALLNHPEEDFESSLTQIINQILTQNLTTRQVSLENIKLAIKESKKPASNLKDTETVFNVIDAFSIPKIVYDLDKQKYVLRKADSDLFPDAEFKSLLFKERLDLLWYRTLKNEHFAASKFGKIEDKKLELVPIDFVLSESKTNVCIMGLLAQITEGQYWLEDYSGKIKINLKDAFNSSLMMEGSIVIAKGTYVDEVFKVENIDFPPPEISDTSRANIGDLNTFGGPHPKLLKLSEKLKVHEEENKDDIIVFLSEFWVDNDLVLSKFRQILSGFDDNPPVAIVLCGNFLSSVSNATNVKKLKEGFKKLANIVAEFRATQQNTHFIFVPGPYDLSAPKILPRPAIPKYIIEDFIKIVPKTHLATNPCRLQYCTKEIVVFREDLLSKLCRNTLHYPKNINEEGQEEDSHQVQTVCEAFANSIIRQSHLTPLLYSTVPVYWKYDQALHLYPTPDLIVVADDFQQYETVDTTNKFNCKVINPGSFLKSKFSFLYYKPTDTKEPIEKCELDDEEL